MSIAFLLQKAKFVWPKGLSASKNWTAPVFSLAGPIGQSVIVRAKVCFRQDFSNLEKIAQSLKGRQNSAMEIVKYLMEPVIMVSGLSLPNVGGNVAKDWKQGKWYIKLPVIL